MRCLLVSLMALLPATTALAVELKLTFPQNRVTFQTNELIDVSVVRSGDGALPAGTLTLTLTGEGSKATVVFALKAGDGSATDHLHLNGWLLKPGQYTLTATMGGATDKADIEVFSHIRQSSYKLIHWGGPSGDKMKGHGEEGMGFNMMFGGVEEISIREKMDIMGLTAMGGMHQHDGNTDCDWSDPLTYIGSIQRAMDRGLSFRTMPNFAGVHLHDEPGLTWYYHPHLKDDQGNPVSVNHDIPAQRRAYASAFGKEQTYVNEVDVDNPESFADWAQINDFKTGYMSAFWKTSRDAVERIKPGAQAITQSMYGWYSLFDGYYFPVTRSMAVNNGHGGYSDGGPRALNPSFYLEFAMARQLDKPTWYLPTFYDGMAADQFKLENYLSFIVGIQGLASMPFITHETPCTPGVIESNKAMGRLGTIFTTPNITRHDVAILYSKSDIYYRKQTHNTQFGYLSCLYMATKLIQQPITAVVEEDVLDGTLAESHKAVIVTGVAFLDPAVVAALTAFARDGGLVLVSDEVAVDIPDAKKLGCAIPDRGHGLFQEYLRREKGLDGEARTALHLEMFGWESAVAAAKPVADALKKQLATAKIAPAFGSDNPFIIPGRQVRGEIEYIFAVNAQMNGMADGIFNGLGIPAKTTATITLADDGRSTYEAMSSKEVKLSKGSVKVDFAAGDMKVFARTARPIGGVLVFAPVFNSDLTRENASPISMTFSAALVDKKNQAISGTAPLQIVVKDPAGKVRYDLFRATEAGMCSVTLPLAANDLGGKWTVEVTDLLAGTKGLATFEYKPLTRTRNLAGATHRAVVFGDDKANIYRFFRDHRNVTIAIGDSEYNLAAAERLVKILKPYNVTCEIVKANEILARDMAEDELRTWCGTHVAGSRSGLKAGRENPAYAVGWDLPNPTIVLGTPEDNALIKNMVNSKVLPYRLSATFPGKGNGMVAWNIHNLGHDVHALVAVGYDAEGMSQAIGTMFEIAAGLDPLFPLALPTSVMIERTK